VHAERSEDALTRSPIDREIERALAVDPSPEFLARVRARIANEPVPAAWGLRPLLAAVGAVVGVIVVVVAVSRSGQKPPDLPDALPVPAKPPGDISLAPERPKVSREGPTSAPAPARASTTASGPKRSSGLGSPVPPARPAVSVPDDQPASGRAPANDVSIPPSSPVRVGGAVRAPRKIVDVKPIYPEGSRAVQAGGAVILVVIIATDGSVSSARVVRSMPAFDQAAIDAVTQWKFEPTMLNGVPVEVEMNVLINFMPE
jgi:TonB family protein